MSAENQSFLELLQSHRRGEVVTSADEHLRELLEAIRDTGTKGSLTVKFDFAMNKAGQLEIDPDISIKKPRRKLAKGIAYLTDDAELSRRDPNQNDWVDDLESRRARAQ